MVVAKEIEMRGTFRFHEEFALAVDLINQRRLDLKPLLTGVFGLDEANHAFEIAGDRCRTGCRGVAGFSAPGRSIQDHSA